MYEESLVLAEEAHNRLLIAAALMPLGSPAIERGDLADAERLLRQGLAIYIELELTTAYPLTLEQFAALAAVGGQSIRALQLAGAGAAWRTILDTHQTPYVAWVARYLSRARDTLSAAEAHGAWAAGQAMTLEQATSFALASACSLPPTTS